MRRPVLLLLLALVALPGCKISRGEPSLESDDPALLVPAIRRAAIARDEGDLKELVELLDEPDPAVRMFAVNSLRRLTGQHMGYVYYARDRERAEATNRWRAYVGLPLQPAYGTPPTRPTSSLATGSTETTTAEGTR
jgi:hypothetical protein